MVQRALKELGYHPGAVDRKSRPATRRAIKAFQKAQGAEETGTLSDRQRVALIQQAAEAGFPKSQNRLGQLFAEGISLPKDGQQALYWFQSDWSRGTPMQPIGGAVSRPRRGEIFGEGPSVFPAGPRGWSSSS